MMEREFTLASAFALAVSFCTGSPEPTLAQGGVLIARGSAQRPAAAARSSETGALTGRVVDFSSGDAIAGALVQAAGPDTVATYSATDGSFEFPRVPVGEYDLLVTHAGYLTDFGRPTAGERARTSTLVTKDQRAEATIRLVRAAVIGGQVIDANGEPVPDATVAVGRVQFMGGRRGLTNTGRMPFATTDDEGRFRIGGLSPGRYYAWVTATDQPVNGRFQDPAATVPIKSFAPGVAELSAASSIDLGPGERRLDVTIVQLRARTFSISGSVVADGSRQFHLVNLSAESSETEFGGGASQGAMVGPAHGTFSFPNVTEGSYRVSLSSPDGQFLSSVEVNLSGSDVSGLVLRPSLVTIRGRFATEDGQTVPMPLRRDFMTMGPGCSVQPAAQMGGRECTAKPDGSFEIAGIGAGRYVFWASVPPDLSVRQVLLGTTDVTDTVLDLRSDGRDDPLTVVVTKKKTGLRGVVADSLGRPQGGVVVAVFSTTPARWWLATSRYVLTIGTQRDGSFEWHGLPPGEYYVNVASGYPEWPLDAGPQLDPDFLDQLRSGAVTVNLVEDETRTVSLAIRQ